MAVSTKLDTRHLWIEFVQKKGHNLFQRKQNSDIVRVHCQILKLNFSKTTGPIFTNLATKQVISLLVCFGFFVPLKNFYSYGDTVTGKIWTFSSMICTYGIECSLTCHTYCDTVHPFIMVVSEDQWHSHIMPRVCQWNCHYLFYRLGSDI